MFESPLDPPIDHRAFTLLTAVTLDMQLLERALGDERRLDEEAESTLARIHEQLRVLGEILVGID